jgi:hypothetical protein
MRFIRFALAIVTIGFTASICAQASAPPTKTETPSAGKTAEKKPKCEEHGVQKSICSRCDPKLAAVYKAKGDWCPEHARAETQCVICNPELKSKGIKP